MKIHFNFDTATRSIHFEPEGGLEILALQEMAVECEKGNLPKIRKIDPVQSQREDLPDSFVLELRLNGHKKDQLKETPR